MAHPFPLHPLRHLDRQELESLLKSIPYFHDEREPEISEIVVLLLKDLRGVHIERVEFTRELVAVGRENVRLVLGGTVHDSLVEEGEATEAGSIVLGEIEIFPIPLPPFSRG